MFDLFRKKLVIIGARGFGRECCEMFRYRLDVKVKGFLDDKRDALDGYIGYPPILSSVEEYQIESGDVFICALGDPVSRKKYCDIIQQKGGRFITYTSWKADVSRTAKIGNGCVIMSNAIISADVIVGDHVVIHPFVNIGHDTVVDSYCEIEAYTAIGGGACIKEGAVIHPHATILPHVEIGKGAVVGAGSVAIKKVKEGTTVFGVPALKLEF